MKLLTKEISEKAKAQFKLGNSLDQNVVAKFFDPCGSWAWFLINQDPEDPDYCWGIVKGFDVEIGSFSMSELEEVKGPIGIGIERDKFFTPMKAREVYDALNRGVRL